MIPITPNRIVMTGELLRVEEHNVFHGDTMAKFIYELFRRQITAATGIEPVLELAAAGARFDRNRFYDLAGLGRPSPEAWLHLHACPCPPAAADYLAECFSGCLVISHEADSLLPILAERGIPYLDLRIAPLRFLDDLHFAFASNTESVRDRLLRYIYPEERIWFAAGRVKAHHVVASAPAVEDGKFMTAGLKPNSLLLCGQIEMDLSLIHQGRVVGLAEHDARLEALFARFGAVYYKPHPYAMKTGASATYVAAKPALIRTNQNIYRLLADDNLQAVAALSSGVLSEAPYFGKEALTVSHRYVRLAASGRPSRPDECVMTTDAYFSPSFWATVLEPHFATRTDGATDIVCPPNYLRETLGMWWGYDVGRAPTRNSSVLSACRSLLNLVDPSLRLRSRLDPKGKLRRRMRNWLR